MLKINQKIHAKNWYDMEKLIIVLEQHELKDKTIKIWYKIYLM